MRQKMASLFASPLMSVCWIVIGSLAVLLGLPHCLYSSLAYTEAKGPFKNWIQVVDFDGDRDQDIFIGGNEENYQVW